MATLPSQHTNEQQLFTQDFQDFLSSVQHKDKTDDKMRFGQDEALAATEAAIGQRFASSDPLVKQLAGRVPGLIDQIDPSRFDRMAGEVGEERALAGMRFRDDRRAASQARGGMQDTISRFGDLPSVVDQQAKLAQERARRGIASQVASQRGAFNPAAGRAGIMATGRAMSDIGADAVAARAAEERAALAAQLGGQAQLRAGDQSQQTSNLQAGGALAKLLQGQAGMMGVADAQRGGLVDLSRSAEDQAYRRFIDNLQAARGITPSGVAGIGERGGGLAGTAAGIGIPIVQSLFDGD